MAKQVSETDFRLVQMPRDIGRWMRDIDHPWRVDVVGLAIALTVLATLTLILWSLA